MTIMEENILNESFIVKDSGERETFDTGARRDIRSGKGRFDLINPFFLKRLALVLEAGATKYGDNNYLKGMPIKRYLDSCLRHINCYQEGDREEDHLVQAAWNIMAIVATQDLIKKGSLSSDLDDTN